MPLRECAQTSSTGHWEISRFPAEFGDGGGLKNRCRERKKNAIGQVLACRILTACGEVAEWPKAAVC
jgi:hypothetical protein